MGGADTRLGLFVAHRGKLVEYADGIVRDRVYAEDVVQEAFLKFRAAAPGRLLDEPVGYLYRIVRNLALDRRRRLTLEDRHVESGTDTAEGVAGNDVSPEQSLIARRELQRVIEAMAELPERTRVAMEMHRFGGCTLKEIAGHLGISISMAQILVSEAVRHCLRRL